jgi:hypothetical protein
VMVVITACPAETCLIFQLSHVCPEPVLADIITRGFNQKSTHAKKGVF